MTKKFHEYIDNLVDKFGLSTQAEKDLFKDTLTKLSELENQLFSLKNKHPCIAYKINDFLCYGDGSDKTIKSHIVEHNSIEKIETDFSKVLGFSFSIIEHLINGKIREVSPNAGRFIGFCSKCEQEFSKHIDSDINPDTYKMALTKYRYLGKLLFNLKEIIFVFKKINNNVFTKETNFINKEGLSLLLQKLTQSNLEQYINLKQKDIVSFTNDFNDLKMYWDGKDDTANNISFFNGQQLTSLYTNYSYKTKSFFCSAQSLVPLPLFFPDTQIDLFLFVRFQYNDIDKNTHCHFFGMTTYLELVLSDIKFMNPTEDELAQTLFVLSMKYNQDFYFSECSTQMVDKANLIISKLRQQYTINSKLSIQAEVALILQFLRLL